MAEDIKFNVHILVDGKEQIVTATSRRPAYGNQRKHVAD